jgi:CDP-2,3-bis-(O-geranylgeranyl)-sn-glycerol synthase
MANGVPVLGKRLFGGKMAAPIDCGLILKDGQPLFGKSKTIRGVVLAIFVTTISSPLVGLEFLTGAMVSTAAMIGDLFSSFLKRRLRMPPSTLAIGLDQIPEALLPAFTAKCVLPLTPYDIAAIVFVFFIGNSLYRRYLWPQDSRSAL